MALLSAVARSPCLFTQSTSTNGIFCRPSRFN